MALQRLPPGYHFTPTAEELVHGYLDPWIAGQPLGELASVVCVADVYGCHPATLTERYRDFGHDGQHWYFLCVAKWKYRGGGRVMSRVVEGGGCWLASHQAGPGQHCFNYRGADGRNTKWLMVEYHSGLAGATDGAGVKVICKVYHSPRAPSLPATPAIKEHVGIKRPATTVIKEERQHVGIKRPAMTVIKEEHQHVGTKRPAMTVIKEERRDEKSVEELVPGMVGGATGRFQETAWLQPQYGGAFIKMEQLKPLVMVRPDGEVLRFGQADGPGASVGATKD